MRNHQSNDQMRLKLKRLPSLSPLGQWENNLHYGLYNTTFFIENGLNFIVKSKVRKLNSRKSVTTFATWNLNGKLREQYRQEELFGDMRSKRVGFAASQEKMWNQNAAAQGKSGEMIVNFHS